MMKFNKNKLFRFNVSWFKKIKNSFNFLFRSFFKSAQISVEYTLLVGVVLLMVVPIVYIYSEKQKSYQSDIIFSQVNYVGSAIIDNVNTIHTLGKGSKVVLDFNLPDGINNVSVRAGRELVFNVHASFGDSDFVYTCFFCNPSTASINGTFDLIDASKGRKFFQVESCGKEIIIKRVTRAANGTFVSTSSVGCN